MREEIIPAVESMQGFRGALIVADHESGEALMLTFWDSPEALQQTEEAANRIREQAAGISGDTIVDVRRYEVLLDERR